ncbi:MAG: YbjQ family protein [Planctomycetota bacterium]|jgi:uncharacterized protein YbjQ (UPF0145 family)|nr:YbjQ family protein [Planctomycetota bacterium]
MSPGIIDLAFGVGSFLFFLALGCCVGVLVEREHYASIRRREAELRGLPIIQSRFPPQALGPCRQMFVQGSVVIGMDYFKRTLAKLRNLIGGRIGSCATLVERARREAVLRLKEEARAHKAVCVLNVKFSTANVLSGDKNNNGRGCVEVVAYGTAFIPKYPSGQHPAGI